MFARPLQAVFSIVRTRRSGISCGDLVLRLSGSSSTKVVDFLLSQTPSTNFVLAASLSVISFDTSFSVYEFIDRLRAASGSCAVLFSSFRSFFFLLFSRWDPGVIFKLNCAIFVDDKPLCEEYRQACWISTLLCFCRIQLAISIDVVYRWEKFTRAFAHVRFSVEFHRSIANTYYY